MHGCEHFLYTDTKDSEKLTAVLTNTRLLKDISRLSCLYQMSSLAMCITSLCTCFFIQGNGLQVWIAWNYDITLQPILLCRTLLAVLHFNENANRKKAITKDGQDRFEIVFPKFKKGGYVVKCIIEKPTYGKMSVMIIVSAYHWSLNKSLSEWYRTTNDSSYEVTSWWSETNSQQAYTSSYSVCILHKTNKSPGCDAA